MAGDVVEYLMHSPSPAGPAWCGLPMQGLAPTGVPVRLVVCEACLNAPGGIPPESFMAAQVDRVREALRQKLRGMSEADRASYRHLVISLAAASLKDPTWSPPLATERDLMAILYLAGALHGALDAARRAGERLTYAEARRLIDESAMALLAMAEGLPL